MFAVLKFFFLNDYFLRLGTSVLERRLATFSPPRIDSIELVGLGLYTRRSSSVISVYDVERLLLELILKETQTSNFVLFAIV